MAISVEDMELAERIIEELSNEIGTVDSADDELLEQKVHSAIREVMRIRDYPDEYTDDMILKDIKRYHSTISRLALYDYNQAGAEGETMHIENNTQRMWRDRRYLLYGVNCISRIV